ncbi:hypothetical protein BWZ27_03620 [Neisseria meningitidis]|nr:hypothetical protein BWZ27_03620 [Neisseria meningitidis]OMH49420.1 hypothetical protein BWZ31_02135 [Neisseria meningitidis]
MKIFLAHFYASNFVNRLFLQRSQIVCVFSNHHKKQPALRFLNVQAAFDREKPSENYSSDGL